MSLKERVYSVLVVSAKSTVHTALSQLLSQSRYSPVRTVTNVSEARRLLGEQHFDHVIINREAGTVFIDDARVALDAGGIAKGFAAERTARVLEQAGTEHAAVNAGGNNRTIGAKADGSPWNVGIQNPDGQGSLFVVRVTGTNSFVTSGDYERFYLAEGDTKLHHIIDPATNHPADRWRSVCTSAGLFTIS